MSLAVTMISLFIRSFCSIDSVAASPEKGEATIAGLVRRARFPGICDRSVERAFREVEVRGREGVRRRAVGRPTPLGGP